jgi:Spy/CpxP family protein refolding chaperone
MKKLIATVIAATFAAFAFTTFAAEPATPTDTPAVEKKHHKKKHQEMHKEGAGSEKK